LMKYHFLDPEVCRRFDLIDEKKFEAVHGRWRKHQILYRDDPNSPMFDRDECVISTPATKDISDLVTAGSSYVSHWSHRHSNKLSLRDFLPTRSKILASGVEKQTWRGVVVKLVPWVPQFDCVLGCLDKWEQYRVGQAVGSEQGLFQARKNGVAHEMDRDIVQAIRAATAEKDVEAKRIIDLFLQEPGNPVFSKTEPFDNALWLVPEHLNGKSYDLFQQYLNFGRVESGLMNTNQRRVADALLATSDAEFDLVSALMTDLLSDVSFGDEGDGRTYERASSLFVRAASPRSLRKEAYFDAFFNTESPPRHLIEALCRIGDLPPQVRAKVLERTVSRNSGQYPFAYMVLLMKIGERDAAYSIYSRGVSNDRLKRKLDAIWEGKAETPYGPNNCLDPSDTHKPSVLLNRGMSQVFAL
jgi:hypothetical protein